MRANSGSGTSSPVVVFQLPPSLEGETGDICAKELLPCLDPIHPHPLICSLLENTASRTYARDLNGFSAVNAHTRLSGRERAWGPAVACCGFQRCQRAHDVPLRAMDAAVQRAVECRPRQSVCEGRGGEEGAFKEIPANFGQGQSTTGRAGPRRAQLPWGRPCGGTGPAFRVHPLTAYALFTAICAWIIQSCHRETRQRANTYGEF